MLRRRTNKYLPRRSQRSETGRSNLFAFPISSNWETYETDRGRLWPLTKKMLNDMGYRARYFGKDKGDEQGVYDRNQWKEHAWWHRALTSKDQLRQRMAWALSPIFVVGEGPITKT